METMLYITAFHLFMLVG